MNTKLTCSLAFSISLMCFLTSPSSGQITLGTTDTFTAVSADGWSEGSNSPNPPGHDGGLGLDGLAGHLQNVSSGFGSGGRWQMLNDDSRWMGDYLAAGVTGINLDFDNRSGNGTDANLRIALDGPGGWFLSDDILVADGSGWQQFGFSLNSLNHLSGGSGLLNDTLTGVTQFEILSSVTDTPSVTGFGPQGNNLVADFRVDNIAAVPEPGSMALITACAVGFIVRRRK